MNASQSLIRAIAICKIFDITTDELLIGEKEPRINPTLQDIVDKNQLARKKKNAVKVFTISLGLLLLTVGLIPVMRLLDKIISK